MAASGQNSTPSAVKNVQSPATFEEALKAKLTEGEVVLSVEKFRARGKPHKFTRVDEVPAVRQRPS